MLQCIRNVSQRKWTRIITDRDRNQVFGKPGRRGGQFLRVAERSMSFLSRALVRALGGRALGAPVGPPAMEASSPLQAAATLCPRIFETRAATCGVPVQQTRGFAMKFYNPTTPGQRHKVTVRRDHLWKGKPFRALTKGKRSTGGEERTRLSKRNETPNTRKTNPVFQLRPPRPPWD